MFRWRELFRARRSGQSRSGPLRGWAAALVLGLSSGCSLLGRPLGPVPPPVPQEQVVAALRERADCFRTVKDGDVSLLIEVQTEKGFERQPTLGGVVAFDRQWPGLWMLATKMGMEVFLLRADSERFWLELPRTHEVVTGGRHAYRQLPYLISPYEVLAWFGSPAWLGLTSESTRMSLLPEHYRLDVYAGQMLLRTVLVDRRRLAVTAIAEYDALGRLSTEVLMDRYREAGGVLFPHRLAVSRPLDGCRVQLRLGRPKFNVELKPQLFRPARWEGWRVIDLDREPLSSVRAFGGEP